MPGEPRLSDPTEERNPMPTIPDGNVVPMIPASGGDRFEQWLATGDVGPYGPAIMPLLDRAREEILAHRQAIRGAPEPEA